MTTIIRLGWAGSSACEPVFARSGFLQEFTQPRNFLLAKIMGLRPLEKDALAADAEHKFIASMRLDLAQVLDQFDSLAPT